MFESKAAGVIIFASAAIGAFVTALIMSRGNYTIKTEKNKKLPQLAALGKSLGAGGSIILNVAASFIVFYAVANALGLHRVPFIEGIFEMTKGVAYAARIKSIPLGAFFFSFGGAGVLAQCAAICSEYDISLKKHVAGKLLQAVIAFFVAYLTCNRPCFGKDILLFSFLALITVVFSVKAIKKLHA